MAISDKTRKILWGRSGNRCAICKNELVIEVTALDRESVVADECHIISSRPKGPRHDPSFPSERLDSYDNLLLLCRTHHKMVDDQEATFTADILRQIKNNHEYWISNKLKEKHKVKPVRFRRVDQNIPDSLFRLATGKEVLDTVCNALAYAFDHDQLNSQKEVDLIGSFFQFAQDCGELSDQLETGWRVQTAYDLGRSLKAVEEAGFFVFGGREVQLLEGGISETASDWPIAILRVLRKDNPLVRHMDLGDINKANPNSSR